MATWLTVMVPPRHSVRTAFPAPALVAGGWQAVPWAIRGSPAQLRAVLLRLSAVRGP